MTWTFLRWRVRCNTECAFRFADPKFWLDNGNRMLDKKLNMRLRTNTARNVIMFLGDGMSLTTLTAARIYQGQMHNGTGENEHLSFERFPFTGISKVCIANTSGTRVNYTVVRILLCHGPRWFTGTALTPAGTCDRLMSYHSGPIVCRPHNGLCSSYPLPIDHIIKPRDNFAGTTWNIVQIACNRLISPIVMRTRTSFCNFYIVSMTKKKKINK